MDKNHTNNNANTDTGENKINELELLINESYKNMDPTIMQYITNIIYNKVDIRTCHLKKDHIEKLNKIAAKADRIDTLFCIGLIYNLIFSYKLINIDILKPDTILTIINILILIKEKINGTILYTRLANKIKILLNTLIKRNDINEEDKQAMNILIENQDVKPEKNISNFDEFNEIKEIKKLTKSKDVLDKVNSILKFMEFFSTCTNLEEQLELFSKKASTIFKMIVSDNIDKTKDFLLLLGVFLEAMLYQTEYMIIMPMSLFDHNNNTHDATDIINTLDEKAKEHSIMNKDNIILSYRLFEQERLLKQFDCMYPTIAFFINTFLLYPRVIEIQRVSITILQRLYYLFPKFRKHLEEPIITLFTYVHEDNHEANKKEASIFLYKLINRDASPEFKAHLESKKSFTTLYNTSHYDPCVLEFHTNQIEAIHPRDLNPKIGFPQLLIIESGQTISEVLEVWKPYSILFWTISIQQYDINISLKRVGNFTNSSTSSTSSSCWSKIDNKTHVYFENRKLEATKIPLKGYLIVTEPGLYQLELDNSFSWFNAKYVKYRFIALEPSFDMESLPELKGKSLIKNVISPSKMFGHNDAIVTTNHNEPKPFVAENTISSTNNDHPKEKNTPIANKVDCLIHFKLDNVECSVASIDKSYNVEILFSDGNINWNKVNEKIEEMINKIIDPKANQKINMIIIYNEMAYENSIQQSKKQTKISPEATSNPVKNSISKGQLSHIDSPLHHYQTNLTFLTHIQEKLISVPSIKPEMDCIIENLTKSSIFSKYQKVFLLCTHHEYKKFYGLMKLNQKFDKINIENICLPVIAEDSKMILKNITKTFYETIEQIDQIVVLASILINIYIMIDKSCHEFVIFENHDKVLLSEDNMNHLNRIINEYLMNSGLINSQNDENSNDNSHELLTITAHTINFKDYL